MYFHTFILHLCEYKSTYTFVHSTRFHTKKCTENYRKMNTEYTEVQNVLITEKCVSISQNCKREIQTVFIHKFMGY